MTNVVQLDALSAEPPSGHNAPPKRRRRKLSPLQVWKERYKYIAELIRANKTSLKTSWKVVERLDEPGVYVPTRGAKHAHSHLDRLRNEARFLMETRPYYASQATALWEAEKITH